MIITDMMGGTPCNSCLPFLKRDDVEIISGVNLYMIISACLNRKNMKINDLSKKIVADGRKNILDVKEIFLEKLKLKN